MTSVSLVLRAICNMILFILYFLIAHVITGFLTGAFIKHVAGYPVPGNGAPIWDILAIFSLLIVFVTTLSWRKYFYMCLDDTLENRHKEDNEL